MLCVWPLITFVFLSQIPVANTRRSRRPMPIRYCCWRWVPLGSNSFFAWLTARLTLKASAPGMIKTNIYCLVTIYIPFTVVGRCYACILTSTIIKGEFNNYIARICLKAKYTAVGNMALGGSLHKSISAMQYNNFFFTTPCVIKYYTCASSNLTLCAGTIIFKALTLNPPSRIKHIIHLGSGISMDRKKCHFKLKLKI